MRIFIAANIVWLLACSCQPSSGSFTNELWEEQKHSSSVPPESRHSRARSSVQDRELSEGELSRESVVRYPFGEMHLDGVMCFLS